MRKIILVSIFIISLLQNNFAQNTRRAVKRLSPYYSSIIKYQADYAKLHEVVPQKDKKYFRFFKPDSKYKVAAAFVKVIDTTTVTIKTSGKKNPQKDFIRYGTLSFIIDTSFYNLTIFQSKDLMNDSTYKNYLFLPFSDATNQQQTYGTGRYIDLLITDIKNDMVIIDFNKAYNPYCAYSNNYNCPIPPKENRLAIAITAGEMNFAKQKKH
jgi:uncharacterized protein